MRDIVLILAVATGLGVTLFYPFAGVLLWTWFTLQSPHQEVWGFSSGLPLNLIIAIVTVGAWLRSRERKLPPSQFCDLGDGCFSRLDHIQFLFCLFARLVLALLGSHLENLCAWLPRGNSRHQSRAYYSDHLGCGGLALLLWRKGWNIHFNDGRALPCLGARQYNHRRQQSACAGSADELAARQLSQNPDSEPICFLGPIRWHGSHFGLRSR